jgi:hypothetical protein
MINVRSAPAPTFSNPNKVIHVDVWVSFSFIKKYPVNADTTTTKSKAPRAYFLSISDNIYYEYKKIKKKHIFLHPIKMELQGTPELNKLDISHNPPCEE